MEEFPKYTFVMSYPLKRNAAWPETNKIKQTNKKGGKEAGVGRGQVRVRGPGELPCTGWGGQSCAPSALGPPLGPWGGRGHGQVPLAAGVEASPELPASPAGASAWQSPVSTSWWHCRGLASLTLQGGLEP